MNAKQATLILYGIANCDSVKKARRWLEANQHSYCFHDYRTDGIDEAVLHQAIRQLGWQRLVNTRSTTWRQLSVAQRETVTDADSALALMLTQPTVIKRPLLRRDDNMMIGFDAERYQTFFSEADV